MARLGKLGKAKLSKARTGLVHIMCVFKFGYLNNIQFGGKFSSLCVCVCFFFFFCFFF